MAAARRLTDPAKLDRRTGRRPDWYADGWLTGMDLAFRAKDYAEVDRLFAELDAWQPPPAELPAARALYARALKQRAKLPEAKRQAELVLRDAGLGTVARSRAALLLADVALLSAAADEASQRAAFETARDLYLDLSVNATDPAVKALAVFREGQMEERLGNTAAAIRAYTEVVGDYRGSAYGDDALARLEALGDG